MRALSCGFPSFFLGFRCPHLGLYQCSFIYLLACTRLVASGESFALCQFLCGPALFVQTG